MSHFSLQYIYMIGVGLNSYTKFRAKLSQPTQHISSSGQEREKKERTELISTLGMIATANFRVNYI